MLITEYFRQIESQLADCIHILEIDLHKDKRSLHIGIIEGKIIFIDESILHFIEFINVNKQLKCINIRIIIKMGMGI